MAIIKSRNKKTGILYAYESESYWDKEKQQPRSRRKLIGKVDETTGEIIPTRKKGSKAAPADKEPSDNADYRQLYEECRKQSAEAASEIIDLRRRLAEAELRVGKLEARIDEIRKLTEL